MRSLKTTVTGDVSMVGITWPITSATVRSYLRTTVGGKTSAWQVQEKETAAEASANLGTSPTLVTGHATVEVVTVSTAPVPTTLRVFGTQVTAGDAAQAAGAAQANAAANASATPASALTGASTSAIASTSAVSGSSTSAVKGSSTSAVSANARKRRVYKPAIRSRASWRAAALPQGSKYGYGVVTGVMLHHTATTNSYTRAQVPAILRSIQSYHIKGRGWKDIAYNVIVDKYGVAWEGRGGGLTNAVVGGHGMGVTNARVFGLSFLGNYDVKAPSSAMLDTAERVVAWKFAMHNVAVYGKTWGSSGTLNAISGHRNEKSTSCPGRYVYAKMSTIRAKVSTYKLRYYRGLSAATVRSASR
ncbi:N-acetylmuramoyl-L-alanine amidase [Nigerium massiliense]|uniref:N-acetylmuramoyl-L-alanine amidase n=1 Tax=Nigerium massiliense TaxID=1522317 RepID=UPI0005907967|nr:N-acetylmuramoyl-L-alanine amidase [Nigerium massiliense]